MPFSVSQKDHLRSISAIICGSGSFAVQFGGSYPVWGSFAACTVFILMHISFYPILFPQFHLVQTFNGWCSSSYVINQRDHQLCQIMSSTGRCWIPGPQGHVQQYPCTRKPSHSFGQPSGSDHSTVSIQAHKREEKDPEPNSVGQIVSSHSFLSVLRKL